MADVSLDPIDLISSEADRPRQGRLPAEYLQDDDDELSEAGDSDDEPVPRGGPRAGHASTSKNQQKDSKGKGRDEARKTTADKARERKGQSSLDSSFPSYQETRTGSSSRVLSRATTSNLSAEASPAQRDRAPSRPKAPGSSLNVPKRQNGGNSSASPHNGSRSPSGSTVMMGDPSPPPEAGTAEPSRPKRPLVAGTSATRSKGKAAAKRSSSPPPAPPTKRPPKKNEPIRTTARDTGGGRHRPITSTARPSSPRRGVKDIGNEWNQSLALSSKKRAAELAAQQKKQPKGAASKQTKAAATRRVKGDKRTARADSSTEDDEIASSNDQSSSDEMAKPKKLRPKPQARVKPPPAKEKTPPPPVDQMQALLEKSRVRQANLDEKQRIKDEEEKERYAREGPKVLAGGPMAQVRTAGGLGALRALTSQKSFSQADNNAAAGPSSFNVLSSGVTRATRAASVASLCSSLTSLDSDDDDEMLVMDSNASSSRLCPYCSEPLPARQSKKLKKLLQRLEKKSVPLPTSVNPDARSISISLSSVVCALHRTESVLVPEGVAKGYPLVIDWERTVERVRDQEEALMSIIKRKESIFWEFAKERTSEVGKGVSRSARGQYDVFEKCQPGYFGEIGQILFHQTLAVMFGQQPHPVLTSGNCEPLTPSDFIYWVLIPELAILLIQEDLSVSYREAFDAMKDSREFGLSVFGVEEGERAGGALMEGWDENAVEIPGDDDNGGITVLRRKLNKTVKHRKTRNSQRTQAELGLSPVNGNAADGPGLSGSNPPASSQTARGRSPVVLDSSQPSTSSRGKRKESAVDEELAPHKKKPRPKPRLKASGSALDLFDSSAPQPFSSQDVMRDDVAGLMLDSPPVHVLQDDDVPMAEPESPPASSGPAAAPPVPTEEEFDDLDGFDFQ